MKGKNGMKGNAAETIEELHICQRARELTNAVYSLTREGSFARDFGLVDQIRRACVSIMSNIAERFERGSTTEFIQYLFVAKGSSGEVRAQLQIASDQRYIDHLVHEQLQNDCRRLSAMISNFVAHLQSTDYRGEKFVRPARLAVQSHEQSQLALRAAQIANMRAIEQQKPAEPT